MFSSVMGTLNSDVIFVRIKWITVSVLFSLTWLSMIMIKARKID